MWSTRRQFRTEPLAVGKMLEIEGEIDGEPSAVRPGVIGAATQRHIAVAVVRSEFHPRKLTSEVTKGYG